MIALSTASVYPESTAAGFALAAGLGYDAVEVMVSLDPVSQETDAVRGLSSRYGVPVCAVHAPCLLLTQRVWGIEPWAKLERSAEMARALDADVVVVHPPFRWQRDYARDFVDGIAALEQRTGIAFAVENMYPWRASRQSASGRGRLPAGLEPRRARLRPRHRRPLPLRHRADRRARAGPRARPAAAAPPPHRRVGVAQDEHLLPGRGNQRAGELLAHLAEDGFTGHVVLEVNTRRAGSRAARELDLAEALAFTRLHFAATTERR